jgi:hypothetical protein
MSRKPIQSSAGEPSFFYLLMAESCFRRANRPRHPKGSRTLRDLGRHYLVKAREVSSALDTETPFRHAA